MPLDTLPDTVRVLGPVEGRAAEVLTPEALSLVAELHRALDGRRKTLLKQREARQVRFDNGDLPDFRADTAEIRAGDWTVAPIPADLLDRRVEITGPTDRKMVINALNSGARVFMADFEDATSPTWANVVEGQINLKDRWSGDLAYSDPASGKAYALGDTPAVLLVRPRGWHLLERHVEVDGEPVAGGLFDFALYLTHNAKAALDQGSGPYFYFPKLESMEEAALWDDACRIAQSRLGLPVGTIKATILIETITAAFEMDEILFALKDHIVGLNCGRWDYIFSTIKRLGLNPDFLTPDRARMVMGEAFLSAYSRKLIATCHRRGAFAMGGMAAQIPIKSDEAANAAAFAKVQADKEREAGYGHDGTWVAHPALVPVAMEVFNRLMPRPNQLDVFGDGAGLDQSDLLEMHKGPRTEAGLRENIRVGIQYIEAWLNGRGAVPLYNLMEDAATAEISRTQVWQWLKHAATLDDGRTVDEALVRALIEDEVTRMPPGLERLAEAVALFTQLCFAQTCESFLTLPAYEVLDG
ncbi:malate synthase A [Brevundimonas aveniformis]|uniref:malate synthase A n=1 Tax=Brevundimonas aveniformis TaxID=370977 RepID=UPI000407F26D|nr:malate synthase A [Brevundimonas aveniformis]